MAHHTVKLSDAAAKLDTLRVRWNQSSESYPIKERTVEVEVPDGVEFVLQCEPLDRAKPIRQMYFPNGQLKRPVSDPQLQIVPAGAKSAKADEPSELRDELGLSPQLVKTLAGHSIHTIEQLQAAADSGPLQQLKGIAEASETLIREKLAAA